MTDLRLQPSALTRYGLPDIAYPVPLDAVTSGLVDGELPFAVMLHGLQQQSREGAAAWQQLEPAMERLAQIIAPPDDHAVVTASGDEWWIEIGPVDLAQKIVTIQRGQHLVAAIGLRADGRLRVAAFRPLDGKSAEYLVGLAQTPHPEHGVCMRENNWEYALDCSAGNGNFYASQAGESYLSFWEHGIGLSSDLTVVQLWRDQKDLAARKPSVVAAELGVHYSMSAAPESEQALDVDETPAAAPRAAWRTKRQLPRTVQSRFAGCLLGGAVGDALGAPVEFMSRAEILRSFGRKGISSYAPAYGGLGTITDDTQMTLFTAEGLIRAWVRGCFKGISTYTGVTAHAYLRWLQTQGESAHDLVFGSDEPGWLFQQRALHHRRAPGNTCLSALHAMSSLGEPARNESKGCGGVMRIAPVGLYAWRMQWAPDETFRLGCDLAALTHGHPTGALTGGVLAVIIQALVDGALLTEGLAAAKSILSAQAGHTETMRALEMAEELAASDVPKQDAIRRLGQGWVAEEALAISVYCAMVARNFKQGVILAVNHDGDSDSTGSITGNLLGAMHGQRRIPADWLEPLELRDVIAELASDLYAFRDWDIGELSNNRQLNDQIWRKYPGF